MKTKLYFAHNYDHRHEYRLDELAIEEATGLELVNPFYDLKPCIMNDLDSGRVKRYEVPASPIVDRDLWMIKKCDGLLSIIETPSLGTSFEIAYARQLGKPIFLIVPGELYDHPWLQVYAKERFHSVGQFIDWVKRSLV